ncbi:MAG: glycerol kinase GlpK [Hyphomonadaceae bacterium]|nr:glycerol kinase GlpK [Hyphomonadaceae bacterium]
MTTHILAIDQGTTSTRAIAFDLAFKPCATAQVALTQHFPQPGWVEHDADEIWAATIDVCRQVIAAVGGADKIACIGITNQRETTIVWDRETGRPLHRAIVWQDRRTADVCARMRGDGIEPRVQEKTGLLLDPYFSATKLKWILDHLDARDVERACFGTVDSHLLFRLTGGRVHATDATNASRTMLYDINARRWDEGLCAIFDAPRAMLPTVRASAGEFGETEPNLFGRSIPITGVAGDQQAALFGHGCYRPGMAKATYGTGCFLMMNMGRAPPRSRNRLLATVGYAVGDDFAYALEGSIFSAGATMQWLRDGLRLIKDSAESEAMAASLPDNGGVYLVPAFAGLGAPQWNAQARGAIVGLTRDSRAEHVVRAGLEAVAYQTADLIAALRADGAPPISSLLVDGGLTANAWAMQFLSDVCDVEVVRPAFQEVTALGAARLAATGAGLSSDVPAAIGNRTWRPSMPNEKRGELMERWRAAVAGVEAAGS